MGDISESMIDGEFDYITGEYIGPGVGYPRTFEREHKWNSKKSKSIAKELAALIAEKQSLVTTEKEKIMPLIWPDRKLIKNTVKVGEKNSCNESGDFL